ncbi:unnamed protein product, partial [Effrenium voratum]
SNETDVVAVERDAVLRFARLCEAAGIPHLSLLSSAWADPSRALPFARVQGETVEAVAAMSFARISVFRPSAALGPDGRLEPGSGFLANALWQSVPVAAQFLPNRYRPMALDDIVLAMRLNVELCDASERVEMMDYRHLMSALREKDVQSRMDADGFISIQWLLKAKPVLSSACNGDAKWMATAMGQEEQVRLDKSRRRVRLLSRSEHLLAEAMRIMQDKPFEVVPLRNFFSIPALKEYTNPESAPMIAFQSTRSFSQDWLGVLREALEHADSDLMVQGAFVASRPRAAKLRKSVEQLFENQDPRLQAKMQQTGELPLTWCWPQLGHTKVLGRLSPVRIVSRYADRLGIFAQEDA